MNTPKHTPTPWFAFRRTSSHCVLEVSGLGLRSVIANLHDGELCQEHGGFIEANAAHIVRCVNGHDSLVDTLRRVYEWLDSIYDVDEESGTGHQRESPSGGGEIMETVRAALKAVDEG